jgi:hypothetical protein
MAFMVVFMGIEVCWVSKRQSATVFFSSALLFVFYLFDIDLIAIFIDLISWLLVLSWKCLAFRFVLMGIDVY